MKIIKVLVVSLAIFTTPLSFATSICEGLAGNPGSFMGILTKLPELTVDDFKQISETPAPFNLLTQKNKSISLSSARAGLQQILRQLKKGDWEVIQQLAAEHISKMQIENARTEVAAENTAPLPMNKKLFAYSSSYGANMKTLTGTDGHTYFAFRDSDEHIHVNRDGKHIWSFPLGTTNSAHFTIAEPVTGKIQLEISSFKIRDRKIEVESFDLTSGTTPPRLDVQLGDDGAELDFATHLANGKRYFILEQAGYELLVQSDGTSKWLPRRAVTEDFFVDQNGDTLFISNGQEETKLYKITQRKITVPWTAHLMNGITHSFMSREGRLFVLYGKGGKLREPLDKNRPVLGFPTFRDFDKHAAFLQLSDGRILLALSGYIDPARMGFEIYDLTHGRRLIHREFTPIGAGPGVLIETSAGPVYMNYNHETIDYFLLGFDVASRIGQVPLRSSSNSNPQLIAGKNKAFLVLSADVNGGKKEIAIHQIWGEKTQ